MQNYLFRSFWRQIWAVASEKSKNAMAFFLNNFVLETK